MRMDVSPVGIWSEKEIEDSAQVFIGRESGSRNETKQGSSLEEKDKHGSRSEEGDNYKSRSVEEDKHGSKLEEGDRNGLRSEERNEHGSRWENDCPFMLSTDNASSKRLLKLTEVNGRCHHYPSSPASSSTTPAGFTSGVSLPLKLGSKRLQPVSLSAQSEAKAIPLSPWTTWDYRGRPRCYVSKVGRGGPGCDKRQVTLMKVMTPRQQQQQQQHTLVRTGDRRRPWDALWRDSRPPDISYSFRHFSDIRRYIEQYRHEHTYKGKDNPMSKDENKQMLPSVPPLFTFPPPLEQSFNQPYRSSSIKHRVFRLSYHHLSFDVTSSSSSTPRNRKMAEGAGLGRTQLPQLESTAEDVVNEEEVEMDTGGRCSCLISKVSIADCAGTKLTRSLSLPKCSYRLDRRHSYQQQQYQQQQYQQQQYQQQQYQQQQYQQQQYQQQQYQQQQYQQQQHQQQRHLQPDSFAIQKNASDALRSKNPKVIITTASLKNSFSKNQSPFRPTATRDGATVASPSAVNFISADVVNSPCLVSPAALNPLSRSPTSAIAATPLNVAAASVAAAGGGIRRQLNRFPRTTFIAFSDLDLSLNLASTSKQPLQLFRHTSTLEGNSAQGQSPTQLKHPTNLCRTTAIASKTHAV